MTTNDELLERLGRAIEADAAATARLTNAPDDSTFLEVIGEIAREKRVDLTESDLRDFVGLAAVARNASSENSLSQRK